MDVWGWILSILSIVGAYLNATKKIEGFYLWIIANAGWIVYCLVYHLPSQVVMWAIYLVTSVIGIIEWRKK